MKVPYLTGARPFDQLSLPLITLASNASSEEQKNRPWADERLDRTRARKGPPRRALHHLAQRRSLPRRLPCGLSAHRATRSCRSYPPRLQPFSDALSSWTVSSTHGAMSIGSSRETPATTSFCVRTASAFSDSPDHSVADSVSFSACRLAVHVRRAPLDAGAHAQNGAGHTCALHGVQRHARKFSDAYRQRSFAVFSLADLC